MIKKERFMPIFGHKMHLREIERLPGRERFPGKARYIHED